MLKFRKAAKDLIIVSSGYYKYLHLTVNNSGKWEVDIINGEWTEEELNSIFSLRRDYFLII